jgi:hypothetical protein
VTDISLTTFDFFAPKGITSAKPYQEVRSRPVPSKCSHALFISTGGRAL